MATVRDMNWSRVENGWHVTANRKYHAVRVAQPDGVGGTTVSWRLTTYTRNNPKSIAIAPTLHEAKAAAARYQDDLETMPLDGWGKTTEVR